VFESSHQPSDQSPDDRSGRPVSDGELGAELDDVWAAQSALAAREASLLGELDARGALGDAGAAVVRRTGLGRHQARVRVTVARHLRHLHEARSALAEGAISVDHARLMAQVADQSSQRRAQVAGDEALIVQAAVGRSADRFRAWLDQWEIDRDRTDGVDGDDRRRARRKVTRRLGADGMRRTEAELPADHHATVWNELRRLAQQHRADPDTTAPQRHADALVEMARRSRGADPHAAHRARTAVTVVMTLDQLLNGLDAEGHPQLSDGTAITAAHARRLACEADIIPVVLGTHSAPLDVGRRARLATFEQRMALRARHSTCMVEGCDVPFDDCEIHHLVPWEHGGHTDLTNLGPVCAHDHALIHQGHLGITRTDRGAIPYTPTGTKPIWSKPHTKTWMPAEVTAQLDRLPRPQNRTAPPHTDHTRARAPTHC
jgi:hypothetical protein